MSKKVYKLTSNNEADTARYFDSLALITVCLAISYQNCERLTINWTSSMSVEVSYRGALVREYVIYQVEMVEIIASVQPI